MKYALTLFITVQCLVFIRAQEPADSLTVAIDTDSRLIERKLERLTDNYQGEEFNYDIKTGESQNLIDRFFRWLGRALNDVFGVNIPPGVFKVLQYLIYALMAGVTIYLIIRLLINEKFNAIFTKKANAILDIDMAEQHIETLDLDALLKNALNENDYRLAVRYQYLRILKRLSQTNIIEWHFDKTNSDYQNEISEPRLKTGFKKASYLYDYIWYGEQPIDAASYETASKSFATVNNSIPNL